jgi:hypothetical protein
LNGNRIEWTVKGKQFKYITTIFREVDKGDDQKMDDGTVYKQILISEKLKIGKRG